MIGYTCVGTNDLRRATAFYDDLLALMGAKHFLETDRGVGWGTATDQPMFSVMKPFDGRPTSTATSSRLSACCQRLPDVKTAA